MIFGRVLLFSIWVVCLHAKIAPALDPTTGVTNASSTTDAAPATTAATPAFHDVWIVKVDGLRTRSLVRTDPIESLIVRGQTIRLESDSGLTLLNGDVVQWTRQSFNGKHEIEDPALENGYAAATMRSDRRQTVLLHAAGHSTVYLNGRTLPGDPYGYDFVTLPVELQKGDNQFLFRCQRGGLTALLTVPESSLMILEQDATLPDVVMGESGRLHGAVVVLNTTTKWVNGASLETTCMAGDTPVGGSRASVGALPPLTAMKLGFSFEPPADIEAGTKFSLRMTLQNGDEVSRVKKFGVRVRTAVESRRRTFESTIDGSIQYYTVQPRVRVEGHASPAALVLTLHGASVESQRQAEAYKPKDWADIVAPTNRRPFGFDWEDWGRRDALEVLADARKRLSPDPNRIYLTGHSMGGHGTWQLGALFPDIFAAIAPSAGWVSFFSYVGTPDQSGGDSVLAMLRRAADSSDTLSLKQNYLHYGIYVLHGDRDDNVPVTEARHMREVLGAMHPNFAYYERPGAGHWWGDECMDWPPLCEFLKGVVRTPADKVDRVDFSTASPAVSDRCDWAAVIQQNEWLIPSEISLSIDRTVGTICGTTKNVMRLELDFDKAYGDAPDRPEIVKVALDEGAAIETRSAGKASFVRTEKTWQVAEPLSPKEKGPARAGPFKTAFDHRALLIVGTAGTAEENAWALNKARFDSEAFWYQGNGRLEITTDAAFDAVRSKDRSVILYGNSETNAAWSKVLASSSPIQATRSSIKIGPHASRGADLALLAVYPRVDSDVASVGIFAGTGLEGCRALDRLPIFLSGVGIPDWVIVSSDLWTLGATGLRGAGFFDTHWDYDESQSARRESSPSVSK